MLSFGFPLKNMKLFWTNGVFEMKIEHKPAASWVGNPFTTSWGDNPQNLLKSTRSEGWRSLTAICCLTSLGKEILNQVVVNSFAEGCWSVRQFRLTSWCQASLQSPQSLLKAERELRRELHFSPRESAVYQSAAQVARGLEHPPPAIRQCHGY